MADLVAVIQQLAPADRLLVLGDVLRTLEPTEAAVVAVVAQHHQHQQQRREDAVVDTDLANDAGAFNVDGQTEQPHDASPPERLSRHDRTDIDQLLMTLHYALVHLRHDNAAAATAILRHVIALPSPGAPLPISIASFELLLVIVAMAIVHPATPPTQAAYMRNVFAVLRMRNADTALQAHGYPEPPSDLFGPSPSISTSASPPILIQQQPSPQQQQQQQQQQSQSPPQMRRGNTGHQIVAAPSSVAAVHPESIVLAPRPFRRSSAEERLAANGPNPVSTAAQAVALPAPVTASIWTPMAQLKIGSTAPTSTATTTAAANGLTRPHGTGEIGYAQSDLYVPPFKQGGGGFATRSIPKSRSYEFNPFAASALAGEGDDNEDDGLAFNAPQQLLSHNLPLGTLYTQPMQGQPASLSGTPARTRPSLRDAMTDPRDTMRQHLSIGGGANGPNTFNYKYPLSPGSLRRAQSTTSLHTQASGATGFPRDWPASGGGGAPAPQYTTGPPRPSLRRSIANSVGVSGAVAMAASSSSVDESRQFSKGMKHAVSSPNVNLLDAAPDLSFQNTNGSDNSYVMDLLSGAEGKSNVAQWLRSLRLHKYTEQLQHFDIAALSMFTDNDFIKHGVTTAGARKKLLTAVKAVVALQYRVVPLAKEITQPGRFVDCVNAMRDILVTYKGQVLSCGILPDFTTQYTAVLFKGFCHVCVTEPNQEYHLSLLRLIRASISSRAFPKKDTNLYIGWRDELERLAMKFAFLDPPDDATLKARHNVPTGASDILYKQVAIGGAWVDGSNVQTTLSRPAGPRSTVPEAALATPPRQALAPASNGTLVDEIDVEDMNAILARQRRMRRARTNRSKSESSAALPLDLPTGPLTDEQRKQMEHEILEEMRHELQLQREHELQQLQGQDHGDQNQGQILLYSSNRSSRPPTASMPDDQLLSLDVLLSEADMRSATASMMSMRSGASRQLPARPSGRAFMM